MKKYREKQIIASMLAVTAVITSQPAIEAQAAVNTDFRKRVVGAAGIMNVTGMESPVSRGEFARMLVSASSYKSGATSLTSASVYADVPREHESAPFVRIAAEKGWMRGYLGGIFKPEQSITLKEAVSGILALLGYTDSDFTGDQMGARMAMYESLKLQDGLNREADELLDRKDCVSLFYNLLRTKPKDGADIYGKLFGCELTSDGEINPLKMMDNALKGPKLIRKKSSLSDYIPFKLDKANVFINGEPASVGALKSAVGDEGYVLVYFHPGTKTIWAYTENGGEADKGVIRGKISNIYYGSTNVMTPSAVKIEESGEEYQLQSSEMQFAFSMYGSIRVGDKVVLVYEKIKSGEGTEVFRVVDYLEN